MKLVIKTFAAWSKWSHPDIAEEISKITGITSIDKEFEGRPFRESIEKEIGEIKISAFWFGKHTIQKIYDGWMWTNDPKYTKLKLAFEEMVSDAKNLREGNCSLYKIGDTVFVIFKDKKGIWFSVRKYKDNSSKIVGSHLCAENIIKKSKPFKIDPKLGIQKKLLNKDFTYAYGKLDEITFDNKKVTRRKSPFPIPIAEYEFNLPEPLLDRLSARSSALGFDKYVITGKSIKYNEIEFTKINESHSSLNEGKVKVTTYEPGRFPQDYLAFYHKGDSVAVYLVNKGTPFFGSAAAFSGVFTKIKLRPRVSDPNMNYYPLDKVK